MRKYKGFLSINENIDMSKYTQTFNNIQTVISLYVHDGIKKTFKKIKDDFYGENLDEIDIRNYQADVYYYLDMGIDMENMYKDVNGNYLNTSSIRWYKQIENRLKRNQIDRIFGMLGLKDHKPYTEEEKKGMNKIASDVMDEILKKEEDGLSETEQRIINYIEKILYKSKIKDKNRFNISDYDDTVLGAIVMDNYDDEESEELIKFANLIRKDGTYSVSQHKNMFVVSENPRFTLN